MTDAGDILVNPERLVHVTYAQADESLVEVVAIVCSYVAVPQDGEQRVAIELVLDPARQVVAELPTEPYYCAFDQLQRRLLAPKAVKKIACIQVEEVQP